MRCLPLLCLLGTLVAWQAHAAFFGLFGDAVEEVTARDGVIALDASAMVKMTARHYRYREGGQTVKFFVVRDGKGTVRAAIDACEVCWREGKGYALKDGAMLCVNCGRSFPMHRIGLAAGGCNPHPFAFTVEKDAVAIEAQELLRQGTRYFPGNAR